MKNHPLSLKNLIASKNAKAAFYQALNEINPEEREKKHKELYDQGIILRREYVDRSYIGPSDEEILLILYGNLGTLYTEDEKLLQILTPDEIQKLRQRTLDYYLYYLKDFVLKSLNAAETFRYSFLPEKIVQEHFGRAKVEIANIL